MWSLAAAGSLGRCGCLSGEGCGGTGGSWRSGGRGSGEVEDLPKGVPVELLSGVTHEDCAAFATDFGTLLDVEDVVPGAEYTLEVSSPGLERKLTRAEDFARFAGKPGEAEDVYAGE